MLSTTGWGGGLAAALAMGLLAMVGAHAASGDAPAASGDAPAAQGGVDVYDPDIALADIAAGEALYQSVCRNCHGPTAKGMASFPKLAGHEAAYLSTQLAEYRAGVTLGYNTALMAPHAKPLSDQDILNLAAYIATEFE